jgi:hypothetical protein
LNVIVFYYYSIIKHKGRVLKTETTFTLKKIAVLSLISVAMIYAFSEHNFSSVENKSKTTHNDSYKFMSTAQLQEEVEKRSINGDLPFDMGLELIKRWTHK